MLKRTVRIPFVWVKTPKYPFFLLEYLDIRDPTMILHVKFFYKKVYCYRSDLDTSY